MDYWDSAQFYSHYSNEDKVRMYAVLVGFLISTPKSMIALARKKISSASLAANSRA